MFGKAQRPDFDVGVLRQLPCENISFVRDVTEAGRGFQKADAAVYRRPEAGGEEETR